MADFEKHGQEAHGTSSKLTLFGLFTVAWIAGSALYFHNQETDVDTALQWMFIPPTTVTSIAMVYSVFHLIMKRPALERWRSEYYRDSNGH
jgi:hypothetical protein